MINPEPEERKVDPFNPVIDLDSFSSLPSLDEMLIPEKKLEVEELESYVTSKDKRVPIFGYPIVSFHLKKDHESKIDFLWSLITRKIISRDTDRCLIKGNPSNPLSIDFLDGHRAYSHRDK